MRYGSSILVLALALGGCTSVRMPEVKAINTFSQVDTSHGAASAYQQGKQALAAGNPALAIEAFRRDLHQNGPSVHSLNALAVAYGALGRTDIAAQFFQEAFKLDPTAPDTAYNIARMKFAQGDFAQAQQFAESAMTLARQCGIASRAAEICRRVADAAPQIDRLASEELSRVASTVATEPSVQRSGLDKWDLKLAARNRDVIPISRLLKKSASLHKALPPRPLSSLALAQPPAITTKPTKPVLDKPLPKGPIASAQPEKVMLTAMPMTALEKPEMIQPGVRLRIVNGVGTRHMARRMALYLRTEGHSVNALANAKPYRQEKSVIRYRAGFRDAALALAQRLPSGVELIEDHIARADIQLTLGKDLLGFDRSLRTA